MVTKIEQAVIASDLNKTKFLRPRPDEQDQDQSLQDQDQDQYQFLLVWLRDRSCHKTEVLDNFTFNCTTLLTFAQWWAKMQKLNYFLVAMKF